jgi:oligopeptide/dipeptide ABC transporter ATP-binding protein
VRVPASGDGAELVRIEDLAVRFQARRGLLRTVAVHAVNGVSLTLRRGETVALVGESGSGKTTLGRATLALLRPTAGRVVFDGEDLATMDRNRLRAFRRRAQVVFQDPYASISPYLRVEQIVEEPLLVHGPSSAGQRRDRVAHALAQAGLDPGEFGGLYPHTLSGGQRQRVVIARAIVLDPLYLVADEPVSMIDASSRAEILALLRRLQVDRGLAMLTITHDVAAARHVADRIAVMYLGRIVEVGPARQIVEQPLHPYTRALLAAVPEPDPANRRRLRDGVPGEPPDPTRLPAGCPFHPRCPEAIAGTCEVVRPQLAESEPAQDVACHLYPASAAVPPIGPSSSQR